jgi:hypothetical protein
MHYARRAQVKPSNYKCQAPFLCIYTAAHPADGRQMGIPSGSIR